MAAAQRETAITIRWLDRNTLADYIQVRVSELPRLGRRGLLPDPSYHLGPRSPRWDKNAVDALFQENTKPIEKAEKESDSFFDQVKARWPVRA